MYYVFMSHTVLYMYIVYVHCVYVYYIYQCVCVYCCAYMFLLNIADYVYLTQNPFKLCLDAPLLFHKKWDSLVNTSIDRVTYIDKMFTHQLHACHHAHTNTYTRTHTYTQVHTHAHTYQHSMTLEDSWLAQHWVWLMTGLCKLFVWWVKKTVGWWSDPMEAPGKSKKKY